MKHICYYFVSCFVIGLIGVILDIGSYTGDDKNDNNNNNRSNDNDNNSSNNQMFRFSKSSTTSTNFNNDTNDNIEQISMSAVDAIFTGTNTGHGVLMTFVLYRVIKVYCQYELTLVIIIMAMIELQYDYFDDYRTLDTYYCNCLFYLHCFKFVAILNDYFMCFIHLILAMWTCFETINCSKHQLNNAFAILINTIITISDIYYIKQIITFTIMLVFRDFTLSDYGRAR